MVRFLLCFCEPPQRPKQAFLCSSHPRKKLRLSSYTCYSLVESQSFAAQLVAEACFSDGSSSPNLLLVMTNCISLSFAFHWRVFFRDISNDSCGQAVQGPSWQPGQMTLNQIKSGDDAMPRPSVSKVLSTKVKQQPQPERQLQRGVAAFGAALAVQFSRGSRLARRVCFSDGSSDVRCPGTLRRTLQAEASTSTSGRRIQIENNVPELHRANSLKRMQTDIWVPPAPASS